MGRRRSWDGSPAMPLWLPLGRCHVLPHRRGGRQHAELCKAPFAFGSTLCFDYMTESLKSVSAGKPFCFWVEPARISPFLTERGFTIIEHYDSKHMEASFLTLRDGTLAE